MMLWPLLTEKKLLERLHQAILDVIDSPNNIKELTVSEPYYDKRSIGLDFFVIINDNML